MHSTSGCAGKASSHLSLNGATAFYNRPFEGVNRLANLSLIYGVPVFAVWLIVHLPLQWIAAFTL